MYSPATQGDRDAFHRHCEERKVYPSDDLMDAFVVGVRRGRSEQKMEHDHAAAQAHRPHFCQCEVCTVLRTLWGYSR